MFNKHTRRNLSPTEREIFNAIKDETALGSEKLSENIKRFVYGVKRRERRVIQRKKREREWRKSLKDDLDVPKKMKTYLGKYGEHESQAEAYILLDKMSLIGRRLARRMSRNGVEGPVDLTKRILNQGEKYEELLNIDGIGEKKLENIFISNFAEYYGYNAAAVDNMSTLFDSKEIQL